ncbi:MAG: hypothetical protein ABIJ48_10050 [Actinomycetota bacterium]
MVTAHAAGFAVARWLIGSNPVLENVVATAALVLTVVWIRFVVAPRARRLASNFEDLTPNLITHGGFGPARRDRRSRRQDEPGGPRPGRATRSEGHRRARSAGRDAPPRCTVPPGRKEPSPQHREEVP